MPTRHRAREMVVQVCYRWVFADPKLLNSKNVELYWQEQAKDEDNKEFYLNLIQGVSNNLPVIDQKIESVLVNWKFERIDKVDLSILRVATCELLFPEFEKKIDTAVIINEALQISKVYASQDSSSFINGILDKISEKR